MNGVRQKRLVISLAKLATRCCAYIGDRCDCKFMASSTPESSIMTGSEAGSGCPELMMMTYMVAAMTEQEFNAISKRAGVSISQDPEENIDAAAILKEEKKLREATFLVKAKPAVKSSKSKNTKSAYDLRHSKNAIIKMMPHVKTTKRLKQE